MEKVSSLDSGKSQVRGLLYKNVSFLKRQKCTMICQIAVPIGLVVLLGLMQLWVRVALNNFQPIFQRYPVVSLLNFTEPVSNIFYSPPPALNEYSLFNNDVEGILDKVNSYNGNPNFTYFPSQSNMLNTLKDIKYNFMNELLLGTQQPGVNDAYPKAAISFLEINKAPQSPQLNFIIFRETQFSYPNSQSSDLIRQSIIETISFAFISYAYNISLNILPTYMQLPSTTSAPNIDVASLVGSLFYPWAFSFILPLIIYQIVLEKEFKLTDLSKMMGMQMKWFWLVTYCFYFAFYLIICIFVCGLSFILRFNLFTQGNWFGLITILVGWGLAQTSLSLLLSVFFNRYRLATILAYFLVVLGVILNLTLSATIYIEDIPPPPYYMYPPFAFYRGISIMAGMCGLGLCLTWEDWAWGTEMSRIFMYLYLSAPILLILAIYLDQVLPNKQYGVSKHPLFFVPQWMRKNPFKKSNEEYERLIYKKGKEREEIDDDNTGDVLIDGMKSSDREVDEDVLKEAKKINNGDYAKNSPVVIVNLVKRYDGETKKLALRGLNLSIPDGLSFGLLGPNGAGKTTLISILTGLYKPTSGYALVAGFDIRDKMDDIHKFLGVCPQFDILWGDLSPLETLLYYARLKGVPKNEEQNHVESILQDVALSPFMDRPSKDLSGGMKRRLSIAISLVGNSKVVFLDEPTTGVDPDTRRLLWDVILREKRKRCIILTTHSLEEADVLCDTIGIMALGQLMCLGAPQRLKAKYGFGYTLSINIDKTSNLGVEAASSRAIQFIQESQPAVKLVQSFAGNVTFQIAYDAISVADLFELMEVNKAKYHITDWGLSQASLEDVFFNVVGEDK